MRWKLIVAACAIAVSFAAPAPQAEEPPQLPGRAASLDDQIVVIRVLARIIRAPVPNAKVVCTGNGKRYSERTNAAGVAVIVMREEYGARTHATVLQCAVSKFGWSSAFRDIEVSPAKPFATVSVYL